MASVTFSTAVLIFINLWLIALTSFGTTASAVLLYILGAVDNIIGSSVTTSILCSALSLTYLVLQSINAPSSRTKSWLARTTIQLPRVLVVCWIVTTTIGLWVAVRQPLCQNDDVKTDATAWEAGLGCWVFRVLVSLNVVMLVLTFAIFIFLEVNSRHVPIGLFHFEFAASPAQLDRRRRRTLVSSAYGSTESLASPMTITSEDEQHLTGEKRPRTRGSTVSPSPTYRTFDLSGRRVRTGIDRSLSALDEESILDLSSSRQSSCTTTTLATLPLTHFPSTPTGIGTPMFTSGHLQSRPLSNVPALPTSYQLQLKELERLKAEHTAKPNMPPQSPTKASRPALYSQTSKTKVQSSYALPRSSPTPSGSVDLSTMLRETEKPRPKSEELIEPLAPAWCPQALKQKSAPLSADPAIKRLTELRSTRLSTRVNRRLSFSGFEFGFGAHRRTLHVGNTVRAVTPTETGNDKTAEGPEATQAAEDKENVNTTVAELGRGSESAKESKDDKIMNRQKPTLGPRKRSTTVAGKSPLANVSAMSDFPAPPVPGGRASKHGHDRKESVAGAGTGGGRKRGKSMVERGRYERLPR